MSKTKKPILKVIYTLLISGALLIWIMQDSINAYWTQTYHQQSPLAQLSRYQWWRFGGEIHQSLLEKTDVPRWQTLDNAVSVKMIDSKDGSSVEKTENNALKPTLYPLIPPTTDAQQGHSQWQWEKATATQSPKKQEIKKQTDSLSVQAPKPVTVAQSKTQKTTEKADRIITSLPVAKTITATDKPAEKKPIVLSSLSDSTTQSDKPSTPSKETAIAKPIETAIAKPITATISVPQSVAIHKGQMVFFAGDSLMQGVAPHVKVALHKKYGIKSIDLSKQSTGLSYSSFFDWVKTVKETLEKNKNIGLLVMFLGPNDPWDMPNPKGGKYLKFKSNEWELVYREKIRQILALAKKHQVQVIWLGDPDMRKEKLNKGVRYLNTLYRSEVEGAGGLYLPTQFLLTGKTAGYSKYMTTDTHKKVAVRTNDGVHFTVTGQKRIARRILLKINVKEE